MLRILAAALAALCLTVPALAADAPATASGTPPLADFLKRDAFGTMKLSPTGEFLAATVPLSDRTILVILRRSDLKMTGHVTLPSKSHVVTFNWVNDKRVIFSMGQKYGELERPQATGELFAVDADGGGQGGALIGYRSHSDKLMHGEQKEHEVSAFVIDTLRNDDDDILIAIGSRSPYTEVDRMNVISGRTHKVAGAPVRNAQFIDDANGVVRFATGAGSDRKTKTYYRAGEGAEWELINDEAVTDRIVDPVGFAADGKTAYLQVEETTGPDGVYAFDTVTRKRELALRDDIASPSNYLHSPDDGSIYAAVVPNGKPHVEYLDADNRYGKQLRNMQASFKDAVVFPASYSKDGALALYTVSSDRIPGDFYLFDRAANRASYVASKSNWFKPEMLAEMKPVTIKARDGLSMQGFLTLPRGAGRNLPLVVHPHGGPFGPSDSWAFDPEVQLLASRGYAVLQLNFRGSGNYGRAFQHAGYRQWGGTMQDDLTDATHWAIDQGIADPKRICMYGASYGGYASIEAVAKEPTLYQCAIGYVGVYDLRTMYHEGDIPDSKSGENFLKETLGEEGLEAVSPNRLAARIQVPVMLVAGAEDVRAPAKHTELMRDALKAAGKQVDAKIYVGEGHGFYTDEDKTDFYTRMLAFLDAHIGSGAAAKASSPASH